MTKTEQKERVIVTYIQFKITGNWSIFYKIDGTEWNPDVYHLNVFDERYLFY